MAKTLPAVGRRRDRTARTARQFPVIFQQVADGELHLTALVLLAPHLTEENHRELLALAKHRTKREVLRVVRALAPAPSIPDRVEPLGPAHVGIPLPRVPSWRALVESLGSSVRELPPGDRPKDWVDPAPSTSTDASADATNAEPANTERVAEATAQVERYHVSFTASQTYVDLLERAQALLSHAIPRHSLEEVHLRALSLLVERLEKQKYGAPRPPPVVPAGEMPEARAEPSPQCKKRTRDPRQRVGAVERRSGTAAVRREVRERDGTQCAFGDERGQRCRETRFLELHHELAHARGGQTVAHNLRLYCRRTRLRTQVHGSAQGSTVAKNRSGARPPLTQGAIASCTVRRSTQVIPFYYLR